MVVLNSSRYSKLTLRQRGLVDKAVDKRHERVAAPRRSNIELREALAEHIEFLEVAAKDEALDSFIPQTLH